jgi:hypothetical protein
MKHVVRDSRRGTGNADLADSPGSDWGDVHPLAGVKGSELGSI